MPRSHLCATVFVIACAACADERAISVERLNPEYFESAATCVKRINGFRAGLGLPAYERWDGGEACANSQARHDRATEQQHSQFGKCGESAQNACRDYPSIDETIEQCLQDMWDEGPGSDFSTHGRFTNMSATAYTEVACGFAQAPDGTVWAVQNFR